MKGGRSHYAGPGKGKEAPKSQSKMQLKGSHKQPGGKVNKNPRGGAPRGSVHDMVF